MRTSVVASARSAKSTIDGCTVEAVERGGTAQGELVTRPPVLLRSEARAAGRPGVDLGLDGGAAEPPLGLALGIGVVRLGRREEPGQVGGRGVDLVGADQPLEDDPTVRPPGVDLVVTSQPGPHDPEAIQPRRWSVNAPTTSCRSSLLISSQSGSPNTLR